MKETHRHIKYNPKKISAGSSNELLASNSIQKKYILSIGSAEAVILHPSFLCPALKEQGKELHLFMLVDGSFYNTYESAEGKQDKKAGPAVSGAVNRFLKIVDWDSIDKTCHAPEPLFSNDDAKANIEVHYLWCTNELKNGLMLDKEEKPFAQIHPEVFKLYQSKGLYWGFQVIIKNLPNDKPGLYDISWVGYKQAESEEKKGYFFELQDEYTNEYNTNYRSQYFPLNCNVKGDERPVFTETETEIQSYHPLYISEKPCLGIGHLSDVHVSSRQHLFTQSNAKLIEGKDGSDEIGRMVNTSYATLKNLMKQMGDDADIDLLIFTGDLIDYNHNYNPDNSVDLPEGDENAKTLMSKSKGIWQAMNLSQLADKKRYPAGIDNLVMYELFRQYYTDHKKPIMLISGNHEAYTLPYGMSARVKIMRSINASVWRHNPDLDAIIEKSAEQANADKGAIKKLIEAEKNPKDLYTERANEGVPADHNLTITEAVLMYGPDYARVVMGGSTNWGGERNFRPQNTDWFYHVFTPLSSFCFSYGKQCFIGLGWGDNEKMVGHIPGKSILSKPGGFLPRATGAITDTQMEILNQALSLGQSKNILCAHFTFANFNTSQPIEKAGTVYFKEKFTQHDYGTFKDKRDQVYPKVQKNQIHYTLSGHSHRAGLYQFSGKVKPPSPRSKTTQWKVTGQAAKDGKYHPEAGARMLVAASGGPIPTQNHNNEVYHWGLDLPSGNTIKFKGEEESEVSIKTVDTTVIPQAKPRLAVALDFADIFLRDNEESQVFEVFESTVDEAPFTVRVSKHVRLELWKMISAVTLTVYQQDGKRVDINGQVKHSNPEKRELELDLGMDVFDFDVDESSNLSLSGFLSVILKQYGETTQVYNTDKNWIYPIELINRQKESVDAYKKTMKRARSEGAYLITDDMIEKGVQQIRNEIQGYRIQRHSQFGEIPDFRFYRDLNPEEYSDETQQ